MSSGISLKIKLPLSLIEKLEPVLLARGLSLDETVRLYLRSLVTSSERMAALSLKVAT